MVNIISESDNYTVVTEYKGLEKKSTTYQSEDALEKEFIKTLIRYYNDSTTTLKQQLDLEVPKFALKIAKIEQELNS